MRCPKTKLKMGAASVGGYMRHFMVRLKEKFMQKRWRTSKIGTQEATKLTAPNQLPKAVTGIGMSNSEDGQPAAKDIAVQWLMKNMGPPMLKETKYDIEILYTNRGYQGTTLVAKSLTDVTQKIFNHAKKSGTGVAMASISLSKDGKGMRNLSIINKYRIDERDFDDV